MKTLKLAALVLTASLAAVACAKGAVTDDALAVTDLANPSEPADTDTDTDTADEGKPIPQESEDEDDTPAPDAGKPADAGKDSGTSSKDAGTGTGGGTCKKTAPSNACGLVPQCGCASGETCDVTNKSTGAVSCVKGGSKATAKPCSATSECAAGLTCAYGACRPYCATAGASCSGTGLGACEETYDTNGAVPNGLVCSLTCDLRNPSAACGSNTCIWDATTSMSDCDKAGSLDAFATCSTYNACKPGLACVSTLLYGNECEPWCRVGVGGDCPILSSCRDVYGDKAPTQNGVKLGHCQ